MMMPARNVIHPHTQYFVGHDELLLPPLQVVPRARVHLTELSVAAANSCPLYSRHPPAPARHATFRALRASPVGLRAV
jgi:hypothetical protein